jgi:hypothetical protein
MFKNNTIILIAVLLILLVIIVLVQVVKPNNPSNNLINSRNSNIQLEKELTINSDLSIEPISVSKPVVIKFNQPIVPGTLVYEITPTKEVTKEWSPDYKTITISPISVWGYNTQYKLVISNSLKSASGITLPQDYVLEFRTNAYTGI